MPPIKEVIRKATPNDMKVVEKNHIKEKEAFDICLEKIAYRKLNMNLIDVEGTRQKYWAVLEYAAENSAVRDSSASFSRFP